MLHQPASITRNMKPTITARQCSLGYNEMIDGRVKIPTKAFAKNGR